MKRLLTFLLLSLYTISSVGASVSTHYCMGKVRKCQCAKPNEVSTIDHCCKGSIKFVKSQDVHANQVLLFKKKQLNLEEVAMTNTLYVNYNEFSKNYLPESICLSYWDSPPIYQLVCNYRI